MNKNAFVSQSKVSSSVDLPTSISGAQINEELNQDEFGELLMCNHGERHETSVSEWWGSEKAGGEKMEERATSHQQSAPPG